MVNKICGIYKITNKITGHAYIGASSNIKQRWKDHRNSSTSLKEIIKKYGLDNFTFEILEECLKEELRDREMYYVALHGTESPNGYNLSKGGENPYNTTGYYRVSKEHNDMYLRGYIWLYSYSEDGCVKKFRRSNLNDLKEEVLKRGLEWKVVDAENAKLSNEENEYCINHYTNNTGFYRVYKHKMDSCLNGFSYQYSYVKNGEKINISSVDLRILERKVKEKNLPWEIISELKAHETLQQNLRDLHNKKPPKTKTGYYRVSKIKRESTLQGYVWEYGYYGENNKPYKITRRDLNKLKEEVLKRGLEWQVLDEEKARLSHIENNKATLIRKKYVRNNTGFHNVSKSKCKGCAKGFIYKYSYNVGGKKKSLESVDIQKLEKKVKDKGLKWMIIDMELVNRVLHEDPDIHFK